MSKNLHKYRVCVTEVTKVWYYTEAENEKDAEDRVEDFAWNNSDVLAFDMMKASASTTFTAELAENDPAEIDVPYEEWDE